MNGKAGIARIEFVTAFEITDSKKNYEDPDDEEWPYDPEWNEVEKLILKKVEANDTYSTKQNGGLKNL